MGIGAPWPGHRLDEIAKFLKLTPNELVTRYIGKIIEKDGEKSVERYKIGKNNSCPFLSSQKLCLIYDVRPDACRLYPVDTDFGRCDIDCPGFD